MSYNLILLIGYFYLPQSSKWEGLLMNLAVSIIGIIITLSFVDVIINRYENKKWLILNTKILDQLIEILAALYNNIFLNYEQMNTWIKIHNDIQESNIEKIKCLEKSLRNVEPSIIYIDKIKNEEHLIEFYSKCYSGILKRLNDFFRLYHLRLSHQDSPFIIDLQSNLSALIANLELMKMDRFIKKEFKPANELIPSKNFSDSLQQTANTINELTRLLAK